MLLSCIEALRRNWVADHVDEVAPPPPRMGGGDLNQSLSNGFENKEGEKCTGMRTSMMKAELGSVSALGTAMSSRASVSLSDRFDPEAMTTELGGSKARFFDRAEEKEIAESKLVAVIEKNSANRERTCEFVRSLGHTPLGFELSEDLVVLLRKGVYFDLLLASFDTDGSRLSGDALALRSSIGTVIPLLLMVSEVQLHTVATAASAVNVDFILAPCNPLEFEARFVALRRSAFPEVRKEGFHWRSYYFSLADCKVHLHGKEIKLQPREFDLACLFFQNPGCLYSRKALFRFAWGEDHPEAKNRVLDVHITRLRKKLDLDSRRECELRAVYGVGYQLRTYPPRDDESENEK